MSISLKPLFVGVLGVCILLLHINVHKSIDQFIYKMMSFIL